MNCLLNIFPRTKQDILLFQYGNKCWVQRKHCSKTISIKPSSGWLSSVLGCSCRGGLPMALTITVWIVPTSKIKQNKTPACPLCYWKALEFVFDGGERKGKSGAEPEATEELSNLLLLVFVWFCFLLMSDYGQTNVSLCLWLAAREYFSYVYLAIPLSLFFLSISLFRSKILCH